MNASASDPGPLERLFASHPRHWRQNRYVYPVISRRSRGLSIGINLNPDRVCSFDCIYCQVDRSAPPADRSVDLSRLRAELEAMVDLATSGKLFEGGALSAAPPDRRGIRDLAFSGDGEPTISPQFPEAVALAVEVRRDRCPPDVKLRLITNATLLDRPRVCEALALMHEHNGEIWAKLDAGTEEYHRLVNRSKVPLAAVVGNIAGAARRFRVVIQSLWMNVHGQPPPPGEIEAFARRLTEVQGAGGRLEFVQVYTVARRPAEPFVTPLADGELEAIAARVRALTDVPVEVFGA